MQIKVTGPFQITFDHQVTVRLPLLKKYYVEQSSSTEPRAVTK